MTFICIPLPKMDWSHFKLDLFGRPDEDPEGYLFRTHDRMNTNALPRHI